MQHLINDYCQWGRGGYFIFKYFKILLEISSIPERDFSFKSLIIAKVTSAVISLKHSLDFGLLFKYRE